MWCNFKVITNACDGVHYILLSQLHVSHSTNTRNNAHTIHNYEAWNFCGLSHACSNRTFRTHIPAIPSWTRSRLPVCSSLSLQSCPTLLEPSSFRSSNSRRGTHHPHNTDTVDTSYIGDPWEFPLVALVTSPLHTSSWIWVLSSPCFLLHWKRPRRKRCLLEVHWTDWSLDLRTPLWS